MHYGLNWLCNRASTIFAGSAANEGLWNLSAEMQKARAIAVVVLDPKPITPQEGIARIFHDGPTERIRGLLPGNRQPDRQRATDSACVDLRVSLCLALSISLSLSLSLSLFLSLSLSPPLSLSLSLSLSLEP